MTSPAIAAMLSDYIEEAERLRAENRQLRGWLVALLFGLARRDELLRFGLDEIERRWPADRAA